MHTIETCSSQDVKFNNNVEVETCGTKEVEALNNIEIEAGIQTYTLCGDDIYIASMGTDLPPWLEEVLDDIIGDSMQPTIDEIYDFINELGKGYTNRIDDLSLDNESHFQSIEALTAISSNNAASIGKINDVIANDLVSKAESYQWTAAWFDDSGAAQTELIVAEASSNYATSGQYTTLHAEVKQNEATLAAQKAAIDALEHQVDGVIETHYGLHNVVDIDGCIDPNQEPYSTWVANGVNLAVKTGDTYVKYKVEGGKNIYIASWKFVAGSSPSCPNSDYQWSLISDETAVEALKVALEAKEIADGKSYQYLGDTVPTVTPQGDVIQGCDYNGDTWYYDTDNSTATKLKGIYVWDCTKTNNTQGDIAQGTHWIRQIDEKLEIDLKTIDETIVGYFKPYPGGTAKTGQYREVTDGNGNVTTEIYYGRIIGWQPNKDGKAYGTAASASKFIDSNGVITGWSFADGTEIQSTFAVSADHFYVQNATNPDYRPFEVVDNSVRITNLTLEGRTVIEGVIKSRAFTATKGISCPEYTVEGFQLSGEPKPLGTFSDSYNIIGGKIYGSEMVAGTVESENYSWNGFTDNAPTGFKLSSCGEGNEDYNIVGGKIYGAEIKAGYFSGNDGLSILSDDGFKRKFTVMKAYRDVSSPADYVFDTNPTRRYYYYKVYTGIFGTKQNDAYASMALAKHYNNIVEFNGRQRLVKYGDDDIGLQVANWISVGSIRGKYYSNGTPIVKFIFGTTAQATVKLTELSNNLYHRGSIMGVTFICEYLDGVYYFFIESFSTQFSPGSHLGEFVMEFGIQEYNSTTDADKYKELFVGAPYGLYTKLYNA